MQHQERVTVLGGNDSTQDQSPSGGSPIPVIVAAVGLISVLLVLLGGTQAPTAVDPSRLPAPVEPEPAVFDASAPLHVSPAAVKPATPVEFATGWQRVDLTGPGWQVSGIDHGPGGWLVVSRGETTMAHTSKGGGLWSTTTIQGLHGENPLAAVGESVIAVAVSSDGRSDAAVARSRDHGRSWTVEPVEDGAWFAGLEPVGDELYLVGSTGEEPNFHLHDVGVAAVWKHDGEGWSRVPVDAGPGSVVTSLVTSPEGLVAFGHTSSGPAAWSLGDGAAIPVDLVLPNPSSGITLTSVVFDGDRYVALVGPKKSAAGGRTLWESSDLGTWTHLDEKRFKLVAIEATVDGTLVGTSSESGGLWVSSDGSESLIFDLHLDRGVISPYVQALAIDGRTVVAGIGSESGATILVRGVERHLVPRKLR
jgi:hypothetical protein